VSFKWNGPLYNRLITAGLHRNMRRATALLESQVKRKLGVGQPRARLPGGHSTGFQPSRPLRPPKAFRGRLRQSISRRTFFTRTDLRGEVFTALRYARSLELGRKGGRIIRARRGKSLIIPIRRQFEAGAQLPLFGGKKRRRRINARFIFRKSVRQGTLAPRPFMRPALNENKDKLIRLMRMPIKIPLDRPK
jgi:hypothetical protein